MKNIYIDAGMGAAGDMLNAALFELLTLEQKESFLQTMNRLVPGKVAVSVETAVKCEITGSSFRVEIDGAEEGPRDYHDHHHEHEHHHHDHEHPHHHVSMEEVREKIFAMPLPDQVRQDALFVYEAIAKAEAKVHGKEVTEIHFHEVGMLDAIVDVVGCCLLFHLVDADRILCSPVHVGKGKVKTAHGILPVPAPATAELLKDIPIYSGRIEGELCTPTGAALLKHFADDFGPMPAMTVEATGYGMGKMDFAAANCVRVLYGTAFDVSSFSGGSDVIVELDCNVDDMTGEDMGYCVEQLMKEGARDAFVTSVMMKKNRPGMLLTVLCDKEDAHRMAQLIFMHTTTIGIRKTVKERYILDRKETPYDTKYGRIRGKKVSGYGVEREKPEFDDVKAAAESSHRSLRQIREELSKMEE